jgi:hypothetical protein
VTPEPGIIARVSPLQRAVALVAADFLGLTACSSAADVRDSAGSSEVSASTSGPSEPSVPTSVSTTEPPTSATTSSVETDVPSVPPVTTTQTGTLLADRPEVGNCYAVSAADFRHQVDGSSAVPCGQRHTAETFAVVAIGGPPTRTEIDTVWRDCAQQFKSYVGDSPTISRISMAVISPGAVQRSAGQSWLRCDAMELANYNQPRSVGKVGVARGGSLAGVLSRGVPDRFRGCARHWPKVSQAVHFTSCDQSHQAELIPESLDLGAPDAPYPGRQSARSRSKAFCGNVVQDYVPETRNFYYYYPTPQSWKASTHDTTCWALDTAGDGIPPI